MKNGANVLENAFAGDTVYRAGGDEFMVFVTDTSEEEIKKKCTKAKELADSVYSAIKEGIIEFEDAARLYSQDEKTNKNGGLVMNNRTGTTKFAVDEIYLTNYYNIKNLKPGEYTRPFESYDDRGSTIYIMLKVKSKVEPHVASIETDYQVIQDMALDKKYREAYDKWISEKSQTTYIKISNDYKKCKFEYDGWLHNDIKR